MFQIEYVIMINCGGGIDLYELLKPDEKVLFFILDSHRPYDLNNIYNERQMRILGEATADDEIPNYTDIFNDESVKTFIFNLFFFFSECNDDL